MELLQLERSDMPSHHTIRRIMAPVVYKEEVERWVASHNGSGPHGEVYPIDGKARRCARK